MSTDKDIKKKLKDKIEEYKDVKCHDPECPFYNKEKVGNMCLMMNKQCISVPPLMCKNMQIAWCVGEDIGSNDDEFFKQLIQKVGN